MDREDLIEKISENLEFDIGDNVMYYDSLNDSLKIGKIDNFYVEYKSDDKFEHFKKQELTILYRIKDNTDYIKRKSIFRINNELRSFMIDNKVGIFK